MKILIAHNRYQESGGEDAVFETEAALLKDFGEDVRLYERSNKELETLSVFEKLRYLCSLGWARRSYNDMKRLIREFRPDVVHFHNIFFMISPAAYLACKEENVPVVQSQHNFRLLCSNALFFRDGQICEECTERSLWRGVVHGCYKKSRFMTAVLVKMLQDHWKKDTWRTMVDCYITATEFSRQKYIRAGIPKDRIVVKSNFLYPDPKGKNHDGGYALYVGRLSTEKGVDVLLKAWQTIKDVPLKIAGQGPLGDELKDLAREQGSDNVEFLGYVSQSQYEDCMRGAKFLIVPSVCYENFPRIVVESYAYGLPVVAGRLGGMPEFVVDRRTGLLFNAGDANDLRNKVRWLLENPGELDGLRRWARTEYEQKYAARQSYQKLIEIYRKVISGAHLRLCV